MTRADPRVWLITGSSSGFGREIAAAALARGDRVVATARRPEVLADLVATAPDRAAAVALDVTDPDAIAAAVAAALDRFGRIDVLVNNAGHGSVGAVEELDLGDLRGQMDTLFFGPVALIQAVLPQMREHGGGAIVQMSSVGGQRAFAGVGAYCAAKFALEGLSEALAAEVAPHGIRVLIAEPGQFRTAFAGARLQRSRELNAYRETVGATRAYLDRMDGGQPGDPAKAAAAIVAALDAPEPLRLALGADAVDGIGAALDRRRADLDRFAAVSRAAVFP